MLCSGCIFFIIVFYFVLILIRCYVSECVYCILCCLKCSLSESWMICVIICVFNALQLCSLHIFGIFIPDHCQFEQRINGKNQWKMNVTMIKRECTGKGCEGEKSKSKEKIITNHISYIWVNILILQCTEIQTKCCTEDLFFSSGQTTNNLLY